VSDRTFNSRLLFPAKSESRNQDDPDIFSFVRALLPEMYGLQRTAAKLDDATVVLSCQRISAVRKTFSRVWVCFADTDFFYKRRLNIQGRNVNEILDGFNLRLTSFRTQVPFLEALRTIATILK